MPVRRHRLQSGVVGSFTNRFALFLRLHATPGSPRRDISGTSRATPLVVCPGSSTRNDPQTWCRRWSPPVRLRYTRKTGRAQQRKPGQQPDQALVRESIPTRVTVAVPVHAFPGTPSRRIGDQSHADLIWVKNRPHQSSCRWETVLSSAVTNSSSAALPLSVTLRARPMASLICSGLETRSDHPPRAFAMSA